MLKPCLCCSGKEFDIFPKLVIPELSEEGRVRPVPEERFVAAALTCTRCGYTLFFDIRYLGLHHSQPQLSSEPNILLN